MIELSTTKDKLIKGISWLFFQSIFNKIVYFLITIGLARILYPADFGTVATCLLIINFLNIFVDFGISMAVVQSKEKEIETQSTGFWITLIFGIIAFLTSIILAPLISSFFNDVSLTKYLYVISIEILLNAIETIPLAKLNKDMEFKKRTLPEILFVISYGIVAIVLAKNNYNSWSIILAMLIGHLIRVICYWIISKTKIIFLFDKEIAKYLLRYGYHAVGNSILLLILLNGDNWIIRRVLGNISLGYYSLSYSLANLPATQISHVVGTITFPFYSKLQEDNNTFRDSFRKIFSIVTAVSIPTAVGIFVIAPSIINLVYGQKWAPIIVPLQILCIFGMLRSILSVCGNAFYAKNKHAVLKKIMLIQVMIMLLTIYPLTKYLELIGTAISINIAQIIAAVLILLYIARMLEDSFLNYVKDLSKTFLSSVLMGFFVHLLSFVEFPFGHLINLAVLVFTGIVLYIIFICFINPQTARELFEFVKSFKKLLIST